MLLHINELRTLCINPIYMEHDICKHDATESSTPATTCVIFSVWKVELAYSNFAPELTSLHHVSIHSALLYLLNTTPRRYVQAVSEPIASRIKLQTQIWSKVYI